MPNSVEFERFVSEFQKTLSPAVDMAARILGFEPRHVENIAEGNQAMPARDSGKVGAELGHVGCCCFPVLDTCSPAAARMLSHYHSNLNWIRHATINYAYIFGRVFATNPHKLRNQEHWKSHLAGFACDLHWTFTI